MSTKETLLEWLGQGDIERVLKGIGLIKANDKVAVLGFEESDIIILLSRFNALRNNQLGGTMSIYETQLELAKIRESLMHLIHQVPHDLLENGLDLISPSATFALRKENKRNKSWGKWAAGIAIIMAIPAVIGQLAGWNMRDWVSVPESVPVKTVVTEPQKPDTIVLINQQTTHPSTTNKAVNIVVRDSAKVGNIITGDSNTIDIKQKF